MNIRWRGSWMLPGDGLTQKEAEAILYEETQLSSTEWVVRKIDGDYWLEKRPASSWPVKLQTAVILVLVVITVLFIIYAQIVG